MDRERCRSNYLRIHDKLSVMIKKIKDYLGFKRDEKIKVSYPDKFEAKDNLDLKKEYLKTLESQESSRQATVETKTSQLIGQTGIIFTIINLFIANYISKFSTWPRGYQILLIVLFLICFFFYLCTILQATKYLNVKKYSYGQRDVSTVLQAFKSKEEFLVEEIKDLIYSIERNIRVNNLKCNNLLYAYRSFKLGTFVGGLLSILLILSVYFSGEQPVPRTYIEGKINLSGVDSTLMKIQNELHYIRDVISTPREHYFANDTIGNK